VTPEAKFKDDLGLDSLDTVEVSARRLLQFSRIAAPTLYFYVGYVGCCICNVCHVLRVSAISMQVVMAFEEEFSIEIPDSEADKILSTREAIDFIASHPQAK
jgi:acyl carrier protein